MATKERSTEQSESRGKLALVVGVENYENCPPLGNAVNDANAIASVLERLGFIVTKLLNSTSEDFSVALSKFKHKINRNDIVLFYFSGHGTQWDGQNYLIPQDISSSSVQDLKKKAINAQATLDLFSHMEPFAIICLLDCCRSYPLVTSDNNQSRHRAAGTSPLGLQAMQMASALIAYACAPGTVANDGDEQSNGLFTKHLLRHITSGDDILKILRNVTKGVRQESKDQQIPYVNGTFAEEIYFVEKESSPRIKSELISDIVKIPDHDLKVDRKIGHGAFGIVYRVEWLSQREFVAVKKLHLTQLDEQDEKTFFEEIRILHKLRHPHIISLYGVCLDPGKYSIVMEYMSLGSLYQVLHRDKLPLKWADKLSIALQMAKGTNYLHNLQPPIFHHDIKSLNILLHSSEGRYIVKLCDFGLAKTRHDTTQRTLMSQSFPCTLQWTAPEILKMKAYTAKSDVYSLGIVFWEIVTNEIPYGDSKVDIICAFVLRGDRLEIPETTEPSFSSLIEKCWAHHPEDRPTCSEIIGAIQRCAETEGIDENMRSKSEEPVPASDDIASLSGSSTKSTTSMAMPTFGAAVRFSSINDGTAASAQDTAVVVQAGQAPKAIKSLNSGRALATLVKNFPLRNRPAKHKVNMIKEPSPVQQNPGLNMRSKSDADLADREGNPTPTATSMSMPVSSMRQTMSSTTIQSSAVRRVIPNLPADAQWEQQGVTVAGGRGVGENSRLNGPQGLSVDDDDHQTIVIADTNNHRVMQWKTGDTEGQVVAGGNGQGSGPHQLNWPSDVLIDKETNSLIIADRGNKRVVSWSRRSGTTQGEIVIDKVSCYGLAMDEQRNLYVSDADKNKIRRYSIDGGDRTKAVVAGGDGQRSGINRLDEPKYIFVDGNQSLYVSSRGNHRVIRWDNGAAQGAIVAGGQGDGSALTQLHWPNGIFVDTSGTLYVAEAGNHRVTRWPRGFQKEGTVVVGGNGKGKGANQFDSPVGMSFDKYGNLYVADYQNHRVQRFKLIK